MPSRTGGARPVASCTPEARPTGRRQGSRGNRTVPGGSPMDRRIGEAPPLTGHRTWGGSPRQATIRLGPLSIVPVSHPARFNSPGSGARYGPCARPPGNSDNRLRTLSAEMGAGGRLDGSASGLTEPGTRLSLGVRLGRPDAVVPPEVGTLAAWAARQPLSPGDDQDPGSGLGLRRERPGPSPDRRGTRRGGLRRAARVPSGESGVTMRNQADSTAAKIGRNSSSGSGGEAPPFGIDPMPFASAGRATVERAGRRLGKPAVLPLRRRWSRFAGGFHTLGSAIPAGQVCDGTADISWAIGAARRGTAGSGPPNRAGAAPVPVKEPGSGSGRRGEGRGVSREGRPWRSGRFPGGWS